jgi:hypothetical protein
MSNCNYRKAAKSTFIQNVGEIVYLWSISSTFYVQIFRTNASCSFFELRFGFVTKEKLPKQCSYNKFVRKMLMKLIPDRTIDDKINGRIENEEEIVEESEDDKNCRIRKSILLETEIVMVL